MIVTMLVALFAQAMFSPAARGGVEVDGEETIFTLDAPEAKRVFLVGDFNAWNETLDRMAFRDGRFEIRLFLVPGRYRYRFVVDGDPVPDPDHPHRDDDGNSFFILAETAVGYEVLFSEPGKPATAGVETDLDASVACRMVEDRAALLLDATLRGEAAGGVAGVFRAGLDYRLDRGAGRAYLLEGLATRALGDGSIRGFTRRNEVGFDDPAALFGTIGPWRHSLGLFCRGVKARLVLPIGVAVEGFYASRIDGERETLDGVVVPPASPAISSGPFAGRTRRGAEMLGGSIGAQLGRASIRWLVRSDRRFAGTLAWRYLPGIAGLVYEAFDAAGAWLTLRGTGDVSVEAEYLVGRSSLRWNGGWFSPSGEVDREFEEGERIHVSLLVGGERAEGRIAVERTTIGGESVLREGRPDGAADRAEIGLRFGQPKHVVRLSALVERFSAGNTGEVFWLEARNPWLDGDRLTVGRAPFLYARSYYEIMAGFGGEPPAGGPLNEGGFRIDLTRRGSVTGGKTNEALLAAWLPLPRGFGVLLDGRWIEYAVGGLDDEYLDVYAGLRLGLGTRGWLAAGVGRDPLAFDRWTWSFERRGRREFLAGSGVLEAAGDRASLRDALSAAEEALSSEAVFTFEAVLRF